MGDRGNIAVRTSEGETNRGDVWFYSHWNGSEREDAVKAALKKRERWDDPSYLAKIIHDNWEVCGISTSIGDNSYPICVVDIPANMVRSVPEDQLVDFRLPDDISKFPGVSFGDFIK